MDDVNKKDIIKLLEEIAIYLELKGENPFKIAAYRKAAQALETDERALSEIDDVTKIKGIGKGTGEVIIEYIDKHVSTVLEELKEEVPAGLIPLLEIQGLGGKKLAKLYQELGVTDQASLQQACEDGNVQALAGFGKKTEEKILAGIKAHGTQPERLAFDDVLAVKQELNDYLSQIEAIQRFSLAGSMRRMRETVKDLDYIISTDSPNEVKKQLLKLSGIKEVVASGDTKISIVLARDYDISVDFRLVEDVAFATTLHHFTGSKNHNVKMRQLAKARGEKISEYGVEVLETGQLLTFASEQSFFNHFGLPYIPPELREDQGEVETYSGDEALVELSDIHGDLHMHSTWSDGAQSIEEMVQFALEKGYQYIAITDHSKFLRVANGLNESRLRKQRKEIERLRLDYPEIEILAGVEMDILPDGSLDFDDDFLKELDYVIGAIHSSFNQSEEVIMKRLFTAMENPYVKQIAHPTGRIIGKRTGYAVAIEALIEKAVATNTILELNANPKRFDLNSEQLKLAQTRGAKIVINTDAHSKKTLDFMTEGVGVARRGWIKKDTVVNTWSLEELRKFWQRKAEK